MRDDDAKVAEAMRAVCKRLGRTGLHGDQLRESKHLQPITRDVFEEQFGSRPVSKKLATPDFPGLGAVDVVATSPRLLMELKWSFGKPGKIFESLWDAIKLSLLGLANDYEALYLATGAAHSAWRASESAALFTSGVVDTAALWRAPLVPPRWPNHGATVGEDLLIGGNGNRPLRAPETLTIRSIERFAVGPGYELRLVRLEDFGPMCDWP